MSETKRSNVTCPFCGEATVGFVRQDVETRHVERNMSPDNVGSALTVTHFDGTIHAGRTPPDWKWDP